MFSAAFLALLAQAADLDAIRSKADALLEEAKAAYESARASGSVPGFVEAGFKLEEARIKYLVLQEIGTADIQKTASDRLRAVNQLNKLINDGRVAIQKPVPAPDAPPPPPPSPPDIPLPAAPPPPVTERTPLPEPAKQKAAEKIVRELYKERYAKKAPAERQALARDLLKQAAQSGNEPADLWILYQEARELAVQSGHVELAVAAADATSRVFDVDGLALRGATLTSAAALVKTPTESGLLADALSRHIDELVAADHYDAAEKAAGLAQQHARKSNDSARLKRATTRAREVSEAKAKFSGLKNSLERLAKSPEDPQANGDMGEFYCFIKGNWDLGLRFLAKGENASLRGLAERDIASGPEAAADAWYDHALGDKNAVRKQAIQGRVRELYLRALPDASGLSRIKIEKRLGELGGGEGMDTGLAAWWRFDEKTGSIAKDASPTGAIITISDGAAWTSGRAGGALKLDGRGARGMADGNLLNFDTHAFTIACFVRVNGMDAYRLVTKWDMAMPMRGWVLDLNTGVDPGTGAAPVQPGTLRMKLNDGTQVVDYAAPAGLTPGAWKHVAVTLDPKGEGLKIYADGAQVGVTRSLASLTGGVNANVQMAIGWLPGTPQGARFLNGDLDDLRIYRRALNAAEIKELAIKK